MIEQALLTDQYQLTMAAAYFEHGKNNQSTFDQFIRTLPSDWGYFVAAGIEDAIDYVTTVRFSSDEIDFLHSQELYKPEFLDYLKNFKFTGDVYAVKEGTPVFPNEPILRVSAPRIEAQILETRLLNIVNFPTLVASKASRIHQAAKGASLAEFGLRRAQEKDAALKGARAAFIGGFSATSNVEAGREYGIPITGTHAHSFVMSFHSELEAFRAYAQTFPNNPTLLIDTYEVNMGARNAAIVAKELEAEGKRLGAVRIDSGDLLSESLQVREFFDQNGLSYIKIIGSNDLNEYSIDELTKNGAPFNGYGVGTDNITGRPVAALSGVYKLAEDVDGPKVKLSPSKRTYPGRKQVFRVSGDNDNFEYDVLGLETEDQIGEPLLEQVVQNGDRVHERIDLREIQKYSLEQVRNLPESVRQVLVKDHYPVVVSDQLQQLLAEATASAIGRGSPVLKKLDLVSVKNT